VATYEKTCEVCGSHFETTRNWQKYCCKKCGNNSETKKKSTNDYRLKRREWLNSIKMDIGCQICGYKEHSAALHFDHLDPLTKSFDISQDPKKAKHLILKEIEKCRVLCANCHAVSTHNKNHYRFGRDK